MKTYKEIAFDAGVHKNWDDFRAVYDELSIADLVEINTAWDAILPPQHHASVKAFKRMFRRTGRSHLKVVELGCYRGGLAAGVISTLQEKRIDKWIGYDINHAAIDAVVAPKIFEGVKLTNWFWEVFPESYDVFVCAHTLEHFNRAQAGKILEKAVEHCRYILLEVPVAKEGWPNYRGSHVLKSRHKDFNDFLGKSHFKFADFSNKKILRGGWRLKNG